MKFIISRITMKFVESRFTDIVTGRTVGLYVDRFGDEYLAEIPWSIFGFRIRKEDK